MKEQFLAELKALLSKYDYTIGFACDDGSDTYGLTGEKIEIQDKKGNVVFSTGGYFLDASDIEQ